MKNNNIIITILLVAISFTSCKNEKTTDSKVAGIEQAYQMDRFLTANPLTGKVEAEKLIPIISKLENNLISRNSTSNITWESRGPLKVSGRVRAILFDPNDASGKKLWAGGVSGGIWYTNDYTDEESEWIQVAATMSNYAVTCMTYDPNNTQILYVGTGEAYNNNDAVKGGGIWKSNDGGNSWNHLGTTSHGYITDIKVRNNNGISEVYYSERFGNSGLYKSIDGGLSFTQLLSYNIANIEISPNNTVWISTFDGKIYDSTDGITFNLSYSDSSCQRTEIATAPSDGNYIYALQIKNGSLDKILQSDDGGTTWNVKNSPSDVSPGVPASDFTNGQGWYNLVIAVSPDNAQKIYVGGLNGFISQNGGDDYQQISHHNGDYGLDFMHADQHNFSFNPVNTNDAVASNDGGCFYVHNVFQTLANPRTISARNLNFVITQFYSCAIHPSNTNTFIAGAQDNGTQKFDSEGIDDTVDINGGDGGFCFIDQTNGDYHIYSYIYNNFYVSGSTGIYTLLNDNNTGFFINRADYDNNKNILFTNKGNSKLYRVQLAPDGSSTFSSTVDEITINNLAGSPTNILVSPYTFNASRLFIGDSSGKVVRVEDASTELLPTNSIISDGIATTGSVSCIELGANEDEILVTYSNYGVESVWYTADGGLNWENKEGDLPDMPVRWALFNPLNRNEVLLATEVGIWKTINFSDSEPHWEFDNGLIGSVRVDMLQYRPSDKTILAATHGRGLFTSQSFTTVGVDQVPLDKNQLSIFPNPIENDFNIQLNADYGNFILTIYTSNGQKVFNGEVVINNLRGRVNLYGLKSGLYFYSLKNNQYRHSGKFIKK